ncbi:putative signal transducing protein [Miniphocaeibacter massiliensis]|uniref:putative signal transducing protein n=1 Tax=Miniphocaeibacter massiliensis TaxID=2041841 RepID=UPI000C1C7CFD|nr:DUF2007 domain-containing protein [Miniphocaeibacter massiliensis]
MKDRIEEKLLLETADEFAYRTVTQILEENKIPYFTRDDESGGYMKIISGFSLYNRKVFVAKEDYEKAYELTKEFIEGITMNNDK